MNAYINNEQNLLLGWLFYNNHLSDRDLEPIIKDHISAGRPLERYFREVQEESWEKNSKQKVFNQKNRLVGRHN